MREGTYQKKLINKIEKLLPGCTVLKNDSSYRQGILDLTIFHGSHWGMLEVKTSKDADVQPNQEYYVEKFSKESFAAFIYPENEAEVLSELQQALTLRR